MEYLSDVVTALDAKLAGTPLSEFYAMRKRLKGGHQWRGELFQIQKDVDHPRSGYAYHKGGREELQFNLGFEDGGKYFRYGVAFSLERSRELPEPSKVLAPKVLRFNGIINQFPEIASLKLFNYADDAGFESSLGQIPSDWVQDGAFIFVGERIIVPPGGIDQEIVGRVAHVLAMLLPVYQQVESPVATVSDVNYRVARLCWNTKLWQVPSGRNGKSRNSESFEAQYGYGHEEWLFNLSTLMDGWKYGFIQALNHSNKKYAGDRLGLLLYSIDDRSKQRFWVGTIEDAEVLSPSKADVASSHASWGRVIKSMQADIDALGLDSNALAEIEAVQIFNVRFRPNALRVFDQPVPFPVDSLPAYYYGTLQKVPASQLGMIEEGQATEELVERNQKTIRTTRCTYASATDVDLVQAIWQKSLRTTLPLDLPTVKVHIEALVDGHQVDAVLTDADRRVFVELKTRGTVRQVIRDALAQLLEYAYWPSNERSKELLIVGAFCAGPKEQAYLAMLRKRFGLPVHYLPYREGRILGISDWWKSLS